MIDLDEMTVCGADGISRNYDEHYDCQSEVEEDPYGAWDAIQKQHVAIIAQAATIEALRARVKAADELADMVQCWSENGCTESALTEALAAYRATGGAA
jgi:hypothetical protein